MGFKPLSNAEMFHNFKFKTIHSLEELIGYSSL